MALLIWFLVVAIIGLMIVGVAALRGLADV
jgi:hypothetical protein